MHKGTGASSGIAIGKAFILPSFEWDFPETMVDVQDLALEFERFYEGIRTSKDEIVTMKQELSDVLGKEETNIFDAHLAILEDPIFMNEVQGLIQRQYKAAEVAVKEVVDKFVSMFELLDDEYMKERALDIKDVGNRLLKHLLGMYEDNLPPQDHPYILVAQELSPSQLAHLDPSRVLGIVTMVGGRTSHTAIMARAMGIPLVIGPDQGMDLPIQNGDLVVLDGDEGLMYINPNPMVIELYVQRKEEWQRHRESLQRIVHEPAQTMDGTEMVLAANISSIKELEMALKNGATGVGLFRTEFLYMDRDTLPKEEEQFEVYREVAQKNGGQPIVIRTLDIGGDKQLDYLALPEEDNPCLGYRAVRILLDRRDLFKTQLKAILRASMYGNVKIMYPMISSVEEVRKANEVLEQAKRELLSEEKPFKPDVEVGIMIEVPAAVAIADLLAREVQFFSIGTNDLVQYVLAVDRMNEKIAHLYDPYHPAIIRLLKQTIDAARTRGIPVSVCGEMAGDAQTLPLWLGLGVRVLSMSAQSLLQVKSRLLASSEAESRALVEQILTCATSEEIKLVLQAQ
ncbi:phosphoenolpyruvate--protein phosphotransferase [Paenibacillus sp. y28]|uniref:phosphoenolpyruvate--protein phosphotransferase n=1 Tax=Paenibacillus sp. y28 TaxID=3129110 RepID=UPI0030188593